TRAAAEIAEAMLLGEVLDCLPGELAGLGVCVLPAVHRRHRDGDLVRELLLGHVELLAQAADEVTGVLFHFGVSLPPRDACFRRPRACRVWGSRQQVTCHRRAQRMPGAPRARL